jgi:hypothetical protein
MIPDQKNIFVYGDNSSSATIKITIDDLKTAKLVFSSNNMKNGVLTLSRHNDRWQEVLIKNISPSVVATNIHPDLTGIFSHAGILISKTNRTNIHPGKGCMLKFKLSLNGAKKLDLSQLPIHGDNTTAITLPLQIIPFQIGNPIGGGKVGCLTALHNEVDNLITTKADMNFQRQWGGYGKSVGMGAQSGIDGQSNTNVIINTLGQDTLYAAQACATYEIDDAGNSPCQSGKKCYNDWFLPSKSQLRCIIGNRLEIGGFSKKNQFYWSSTEKNAEQSYGLYLSGAGYNKGIPKNEHYKIRCVRSLDIEL